MTFVEQCITRQRILILCAAISLNMLYFLAGAFDLVVIYCRTRSTICVCFARMHVNVIIVDIDTSIVTTTRIATVERFRVAHITSHDIVRRKLAIACLSSNVHCVNATLAAAETTNKSDLAAAVIVDLRKAFDARTLDCVALFTIEVCVEIVSVYRTYVIATTTNIASTLCLVFETI